MKKKIALLPLLLFCTVVVVAQKNTPNRAYNLFYEKNLNAAKKCIDQCILNEKYNARATTWLYKANIDYGIAREEYAAKQNDSLYVIAHPNAPSEAFGAFKKAQSINKNVEGFDMYSPGDALPEIYPYLFIEGVNELIAGRFDTAEAVLAMAVESYEMLTPPKYPLNGELYYYYAYTLEMLKDYPRAEACYRKAIADGSKNINVFIRLIENYKNENRRDEVLALIREAQKNDPNNASIYIAEADYYYWTGDVQRGREMLKKMPATVYNTPDALINAANLYIQDSNYVEAEKLLKKTYATYPNGIIAHNLGVCCSNIGEAKYLEANRLSISGKQTEGETIKQEADNYMKEAAKYFEKAWREDKKNINVLYKLKEIYLRLGQETKAAETDDRIKTIEK